jgi:hypothetical protein
METIRLEFQPNIRAKIMEVLSSFSSDELKIVQERSTFEEERRKLEACVAEIDNGTAQFVSFEELDLFLEETISRYED